MLVDKSTSNRKSFSSFLQFKEMCGVLMSNDELSEDANQDTPRGRTRTGSRGTGRNGARGPGGHRGQWNRSGTRGGRGGRGGLGWLGPCTAVNIKHDTSVSLLPNFVDVRRPSIYGNPNLMNSGMSRSECLRRYETHILNNHHIMNTLCNLRGCILGCTCLPRDCHATVLANIVNNLD